MPSLMSRLVGRFSVLSGERAMAAANVLLNSIVVARALPHEVAAYYFFVTSVAQVLMSPWVSAAEITWVGADTRDSKARDAALLKRLAMVCAMALVGAGTLTLAVGAAYLRLIGGYFPLLLMSVISTVLYASILYLAPSKYSDPRRFLMTVTLALAAGLVVKAAALAWRPDLFLACLAMFSESAFLALGVLVSRDRAPRAPRAQAAQTPQLTAAERSVFLTTAASIVVVLLCSRLTLVLSPLVIGVKPYAAFGLAFQVLNSASFAAAAINGATVYVLRTDRQGEAGYVRALLAAAASVAVIAIIAFAVLGLWGQAVLLTLLGPQGAETTRLAVAGFPFCVSLLLQGVSMAASSIKRTVPLFTLGCLVTAVVSTGAFLVAGEGLANRVLWWSSTHLACSLLLFGLTTLSRSQIRRLMMRGAR